jgi:hypothetical protein
VFGDMVDTRILLRIVQFKGRDLLMAEEYFDQTVFGYVVANLDWLTMKRFAHRKGMATVVDFTAALHRAHVSGFGVLDGGQGVRIRPGTGYIARGGRLHTQCLMGPFVVVAVTPGIKARLCLCQILEVTALQHFEFETAMKALILAQGLRMIGTRMAHPNAQTDQPHRQRRVRAVRRIAPARRGQVLQYSIRF